MDDDTKTLMTGTSIASTTTNSMLDHYKARKRFKASSNMNKENNKSHVKKPQPRSIIARKKQRQEEKENLTPPPPRATKSSETHNLTTTLEYQESMKSQEVRRRLPLADTPFSNQRYLSVQMRTILMDWIMEVCEAFHLQRKTFYLSILYVDSFLLAEPDLVKSRLQLLGVSALMLATKVEEIYPPSITEFVHLTECAYTPSDLIEMERDLVMTLEWHLNPITPCHWVHWILLSHFHFQHQDDDDDDDEDTHDTSYHVEMDKQQQQHVDECWWEWHLRQETRMNRRQGHDDLHWLHESNYETIMHLIDFVMLDAQVMHYSSLDIASSAIRVAQSTLVQPEGLESRRSEACLKWMKHVVHHRMPPLSEPHVSTLESSSSSSSSSGGTSPSLNTPSDESIVILARDRPLYQSYTRGWATALYLPRGEDPACAQEPPYPPHHGSSNFSSPTSSLASEDHDDPSFEDRRVVD